MDIAIANPFSLSYTSSWLLRRKIIQIHDKEAAKEVTYINEKFVLAYLIEELTASFSDINIPNDQSYIDFINLLYYFLKYRNCDPQALELMIMSYLAAFSLISNEIGVDLSKFTENLFSEPINDEE